MFTNKNYEELDSLLKQAKKALDKETEEETNEEEILPEVPAVEEEPVDSENVKQEAVQLYKSGKVNEAVEKVIDSVKNKKEPNKGRVDETMVNVFFQDVIARKLLTEDEVNAFKSLVNKRAGEVNGAVSADQQNAAENAEAKEADTAMNQAVEPQNPSDIEQNDNLPGVNKDEELPDLTEPGTDINMDEQDPMDKMSSLEDKTKKIASLLEDIKNYKPAKTKEEVILEVAASTNDSLEFLKKTAVALSEETQSPEHAGRKAFTDKTVTKEGGETPKFPGQKIMMQNNQEVVSVYNTKGKPETDVFVDKAGRQNVTSINTGSGTIGFVQSIKLDEPVDLKGFSYKGAVTGERFQQQPKDEGEKLAGAGHETKDYYDQVKKVAPKAADAVAGKWPKEAKEPKAVEAAAKPGLTKKADDAYVAPFDEENLDQNPEENVSEMSEGYHELNMDTPVDNKESKALPENDSLMKLTPMYFRGVNAYKNGNFAEAARLGKAIIDEGDVYAQKLAEHSEQDDSDSATQVISKRIEKLNEMLDAAHTWVDAPRAHAAERSALQKESSALGFNFLQKKADAPIPTDNIQNSSSLGSDAALEPHTDVIKEGTKVNADEIKAYQAQQIKAFADKEAEIKQHAVAAEEADITVGATDNPSGNLEKQDPTVPVQPVTPEVPGQKESPLQKELTDLLNTISKEAPAEFSKFKAEANNPKLLKQDILDYLKQKKQMMDADKFNVCDFDKIAETVFGIKKVQPKESATEEGKAKEEKKEEKKEEGGDEELPSLDDLLK